MNANKLERLSRGKTSSLICCVNIDNRLYRVSVTHRGMRYRMARSNSRIITLGDLVEFLLEGNDIEKELVYSNGHDEYELEDRITVTDDFAVFYIKDEDLIDIDDRGGYCY